MTVRSRNPQGQVRERKVQPHPDVVPADARGRGDPCAAAGVVSEGL
jgi:hypothetical protein